MAKKRAADWTRPRLEGKTFVLVGKAFRAVRDAGKLVAAEGASIVQEITPDVDYVVVPMNGREDRVDAIRRSARRLNRKGANVQVLRPHEISGVLALTPTDLIAMFRAGKPGVTRYKKLINAVAGLGDDKHPSQLAFDLSGKDLRGVAIPSTNLKWVNLDRANLKDAVLRNSDLPPLRGTRANGADLRDCRLRALNNVTFKEARLNHIRFATGAENKVIAGCNFDGAWLTQATGSLRRFSKCSFRGALMRRASMELADVSGCNFSEATLDGSNFHEAALVKVKLVRAKLKNVILSRANLQGADLTEADFRGAYLVGADLSKCKVDGADFRGANLFAVNVDGVDVSKAKGLESVRQPIGEIGLNAEEFIQQVKPARSVTTSVKIRLPGGDTVELRIAIESGRASAQLQITGGKPAVLNTRGRQICSSESIDQAMLQAAAAIGWGTLIQNTLDVQSTGAAVDHGTLKQAALAALCELFGEEPASHAAVAQQQTRHAERVERLQEKLLTALRRKVRGINNMDQITHDNVHLIHKRMETIRKLVEALRSELGAEAVIDLRAVELPKANLVGVSFYRMDLTGANLTGAFGGTFDHVSLKDANLQKARIASAAHADLTGADLRNAELQGACLLGARLDAADLEGANLCGAELVNIYASGANWNRATFDAKTRFSPHFELPDELIWTGTGTDPRHRRTAAAKAKKPKAAGKRSGRTKKSTAEVKLSLKCLLTDKQLAKACADAEHDSAFPDGMDREGLRHPIYGPDLIYSICLEYCPNRFREFALTQQEFDFNVWYRAERFALLFDAVENCYSDGDHDRAERLMPEMPGALVEKAYRRMQREVRKVLATADS